jgi:hypothetical protein
LRRQHPFRGTLSAPESRPAPDRDRHAGLDGAGAFLCYRRPSSPIRTARPSP